ncbi:MAG: hypothetical protein LBP51_01585 [Deferribacteraceae bacterium]|jgi:flagellar basal-body rod protein FlgC|nr:hypothetical protein [Deferribacteraceae bacterium]
MLNSINSASSALRAYTEVLNTSARNVANINTEGYTPQRTRLSEGSSGVRATVESVPRTVNTVNNVNNVSKVDYASEAVEQIISLRAFEANASVIRTADEMLGSLINIIT